MNKRIHLLSEVISQVANDENLPVDVIKEGIRAGGIVILGRREGRNVHPIGLGKGIRTKVNANIGISGPPCGIDTVQSQLYAALKAGTDTVMDLTCGGDLNGIRQMLLAECPTPVGTVPVYQIAADATKKHKNWLDTTVDEIFEAFESHLQDGVDFFVAHAALTREVLETLKSSSRAIPIVSRGGSLIVSWMVANNAENPLYENFDRLLKLAARYQAAISLGDALRSGCLNDALDEPKIQEFIVNGELVRRARKSGVHVLVEGPGHVPLHLINSLVDLAKGLCHGAPLYLLGPLVTDIAPGYDHIVAAIGAAVAAARGADFICYVTPSEHVALPADDAVHQGVIAARIAAHAADIAKGIKGATEWDNRMMSTRAKLDWQGQANCAIDPDRLHAMWGNAPPSDGTPCTMCGDMCAIKLTKEALGLEPSKTC